MIELTAWDLTLAAGLVAVCGAASLALRLQLARQLTVAAVRAAAQLLLVGLILKALFTTVHPGAVAAAAMAMVVVAGYEIRARQTRRFSGWWGYGVGTLSMLVSSFAVTALALMVIIEARPWYTPRYAIPLLGMLLGNTMTAVALALDRLVQGATTQRAVLETRLGLGQSASETTEDLRRESLRAGLIPTINAMAAAGVVSLPGMMTGQILAGASPMIAVRYQILILFLISAGTFAGILLAVEVAARRLFDERQRLRLDRLHG